MEGPATVAVLCRRRIRSLSPGAQIRTSAPYGATSSPLEHVSPNGEPDTSTKV
jgi:hypothetical protein